MKKFTIFFGFARFGSNLSCFLTLIKVFFDKFEINNPERLLMDEFGSFRRNWYAFKGKVEEEKLKIVRKEHKKTCDLYKKTWLFI